MVRNAKVSTAERLRARRRVLTKDDFALPGDDIPPQDPIDRETWEYITTLPTDVAIQTSDHNGSKLKNLHILCSQWIELIEIGGLDKSDMPEEVDEELPIA
jgi:hypothetical protein